MRTRSACFAALICILSCMGCSSSFDLSLRSSPAADKALSPEVLSLLRNGGYILYFRHGLTDWSEKDQSFSDLTSCALQRNLSAEGRKQMAQIGRAIALLQIPIGDIYSSPLCRTRESAELMFGSAVLLSDLQERDAPDASMSAAHVKSLRKLLQIAPAAGTNAVIVSHQPNFESLSGIALEQGEAAIVDPTSSRRLDTVVVVQRVKSERWSATVAAAR